jgi:hypothetical protein
LFNPFFLENYNATESNSFRLEVDTNREAFFLSVFTKIQSNT